MYSMWMHWTVGTVENKDFKNAWGENVEDLRKFEGSQVYQNWIGSRDQDETIFQAMAQHYCGHKYTGDEAHFEAPQYRFKKTYCPEAINTENHYNHPWDNFMI